MVALEEVKRTGGDVTLTHTDWTMENDPWTVDAQRLHRLHHELPFKCTLGTLVLPLGFFQGSPFLADGQHLTDNLFELIQGFLEEWH